MNYLTDTKKGRYPLVHPEKYCSIRPPIYKSGWERRVFGALDNNPYVLKWGYEPVEIYYLHPVYQNWTVYYPDILIHTKVGETNRQMLWEIKPKKFLTPPVRPNPPKKPGGKNPGLRFQTAMKRFERDYITWMINQQKWKAASDWCHKNGIEWLTVTEDDVSGFFTKSNV
jgi:hypothetical protein